MDFFRLDSYRTINLDHVTMIIKPPVSLRGEIKLIMSNGIVIMVSDEEWERMKLLIESYTYYTEARDERIENQPPLLLQLELPFDPPARGPRLEPIDPKARE